jgi:hypothetical protein
MTATRTPPGIRVGGRVRSSGVGGTVEEIRLVGASGNNVTEEVYVSWDIPPAASERAWLR